MVLYVDGILSATQSHTAAMNIAGNSGISIGESNQANGYWGHTDGKIDDIGIWNRALTQAEITNLNNSTNTSITEKENLGQFIVYPNPASTEITINSSVKFTTIKIVNTIGQTILTKESSKSALVSALSNGIYFIELYDEKGKLLKIGKFIKE